MDLDNLTTGQKISLLIVGIIISAIVLASGVFVYQKYISGQKVDTSNISKPADWGKFSASGFTIFLPPDASNKENENLNKLKKSIKKGAALIENIDISDIYYIVKKKFGTIMTIEVGKVVSSLTPEEFYILIKQKKLKEANSSVKVIEVNGIKGIMIEEHPYETIYLKELCIVLKNGKVFKFETSEPTDDINRFRTKTDIFDKIIKTILLHGVSPKDSVAANF